MKHSPTRMRAAFALFLVAAMFAFASPASAIDEAESLLLLVRTLDQIEDPAVQTSLLRGMLSGLEGRRNVQAPPLWKKVSLDLSHSDDDTVRKLSQQLAQIFGDEKATARSLAIVNDQSAGTPARRAALRALLMQRNEEASDILESLIAEPDLALDAARRAVANAEKVLDLKPDETRALCLSAMPLYRIGRVEDAYKWVERAVFIEPEDPAVQYNVACFYALTGETERALHCLEHSSLSGMANRSWIENDSDLDPIREHPRFKKLLEGLTP